MGHNIVITLDVSEDGRLEGINIAEGGDFSPAVGVVACRGAADYFSGKVQDAEIARRVAEALAQGAGSVEVEHDQLAD